MMIPYLMGETRALDTWLVDVIPVKQKLPFGQWQIKCGISGFSWSVRRVMCQQIGTAFVCHVSATSVTQRNEGECQRA